MPKQTSNSPSPKQAQPLSSEALVPSSLHNLSDKDVASARPLVAMLKNPGLSAKELHELLNQSQELKALAFDIFLVRSLLQDTSQARGEQLPTTAVKAQAPKLTEDQKDKITSRLLRLREKIDLPQEERIYKTWSEFSKKIPNLSIWQVRAYDAHITMRINSDLS